MAALSVPRGYLLILFIHPFLELLQGIEVEWSIAVVPTEYIVLDSAAINRGGGGIGRRLERDRKKHSACTTLSLKGRTISFFADSDMSLDHRVGFMELLIGVPVMNSMTMAL